MTNVQAVEDFIRTIDGLFEVDYGDFKRKVGLYVSRLRNGLIQPSDETLQIIERMRDLLYFHPTGEVEATRQDILELASQLMELEKRQAS